MAKLGKIFSNYVHAVDKVYGGKKLRSSLHLRGKNFKSAVGIFRKLYKGAGSVPDNSAGSVAYGDIYGPTGSIVGRY